MEAGKRKRGVVDDGDQRSRSKEKGAIDGGESAVTDEEVEEFFAILRRIHVAVKYFEKNDGKRWKPSFEKEDLKVATGDDEPEKKDEDCKDGSTGLDLNSDPPSEDNDSFN